MRWVRLSQVPAAERTAALRVQAMTWQPFEDTARVLLLQGEEGLVVAWDQQQAEAALRAAGLDPARVRCIPETLLREPQSEGLHLLDGADGFEAQCWQGPCALRASRWWAERPTAAELEQWARALPIGFAGNPLPQWVSAPAWRKRPWGQLVGQSGMGANAGSEARLLWWVGGAFALAAGLVGAQVVGAERAVAQLRADNAALRASMDPILKQRERALAQAAEAERWAQWLNAPLPIELIQQLHDSLGRLGVQLREMELRGQSLRLGLLLPPQVPRADLLKALQTSGWFTQVTEARVDNQRDLLWLELMVRGAIAPSLAQAEPPPESSRAKTLPSASPAQGTGPAPNATAPVAATAATATAAPAQAALPPARALPAGPGPARAAGPSQVAPKPIGPAASAGEFPPSSVFDAIK
ncbi:MAG: hypothetical protein ACK5O3_14565 [Burkholderiales bacterium]|jgi:Tfp pilus assembly protein PilN